MALPPGGRTIEPFPLARAPDDLTLVVAKKPASQTFGVPLRFAVEAGGDPGLGHRRAREQRALACATEQLQTMLPELGEAASNTSSRRCLAAWRVVDMRSWPERSQHDSYCHHYAEGMARWQPNARGRLEQAAMELYSERGFEQTTVTEIAKRAGLTERTFFRHFADKREVLFSGAGLLQQGVISAVEAAPDSLAPIDAVAAAFEGAAVFLQERRAYARQRQTIIAANAELQERELIKLASLASAIAGALRQRGVGDAAASLTAEAGVAVFRISVERWTTETEQRDLRRVIRNSLEELKAVIAGNGPPAAAPAERGVPAADPFVATS